MENQNKIIYGSKITINYEEETFMFWQKLKYVTSAILLITLVYLMGILANAETVNKLKLHPVSETKIARPTKINNYNLNNYKYKTYSNSNIHSIKDLTSQVPPVGNQDTKGSCVGWAVGRYLQSFYQSKDWGWDVKSSSNWNSPDFIYNLRTKYYDQYGNLKTGMMIDEAFNILKSYGCCYESYMPYNLYDEQNPKYPSSTAFKNALNYKAKYIIAENYNPNYPSIVKEWLKEYISKGNVAVVQIPVGYDFDTLSNSNQIYNSIDKEYPDYIDKTNWPSDKIRGYHALCIIGYDDTKQAFKFINSWGTAWGLSGYGYISYDLFCDYRVGCSPYSIEDEDTGHKIKFYDWKQSNSKVGSNYKFNIKFTALNKTLKSKGQSIYTTSHNYKIAASCYEDDAYNDYSKTIYQTLKLGWNSIKFTVKENSGRYKGQTSVVTVRVYIYN